MCVSQADKEREEHRRQVEHSLGQPYMRDDSSLTNSYSSSIDEYPAYSRESSVEGNNAETLRQLLHQVNVGLLLCNNGVGSLKP